MTRVEHDLIARRVVDVMKREGQLDDAEIATEMSADFRDGVDDRLADLLRDLRKLGPIEFAQIGGRVDGVE